MNKRKPSQDEINQYNTHQLDTESHLINFCKLLIGLCVGALSLTLGAIIINGNSFYSGCVLYLSWGFIISTIITLCLFMAVVISSKYIYLNRLKYYMYDKKAKEPLYPFQITRSILAILGGISFAIGFTLMGFAVFSSL
ncbi:hypothetical protein [Thiohalophilus thiocyanatoxydans]|uniref:hypothetical protein n=1 Tax=Thiohalophilus thiocyanatoxydans TaxID=381308 RepID=UPI0010663690|nr:hypothetical protein [Thiohalophilus thiocyanatoxydans]